MGRSRIRGTPSSRYRPWPSATMAVRSCMLVPELATNRSAWSAGMIRLVGGLRTRISDVAQSGLMRKPRRRKPSTMTSVSSHCNAPSRTVSLVNEAVSAARTRARFVMLFLTPARGPWHTAVWQAGRSQVDVDSCIGRFRAAAAKRKHAVRRRSHGQGTTPAPAPSALACTQSSACKKSRRPSTPAKNRGRRSSNVPAMVRTILYEENRRPPASIHTYSPARLTAKCTIVHTARCTSIWAIRSQSCGNRAGLAEPPRRGPSPAHQANVLRGSNTCAKTGSALARRESGSDTVWRWRRDSHQTYPTPPGPNERQHRRADGR